MTDRDMTAPSLRSTRWRHLSSLQLRRISAPSCSPTSLSSELGFARQPLLSLVLL